MSILSGSVCGFLHMWDDSISGLVLNTGAHVHFPTRWAYEILLVAPLNSRVEVSGSIRRGAGEESHIDAEQIENVNTKRFIILHAPTNPQVTEVSALSFPPGYITDGSGPFDGATESTIADNAHRESSTPKTESASVIERAYNRLHRTQAILAHLQMPKQEAGAQARCSDEAEYLYMQALSRHQECDFEGAAKSAAASGSISLLIENVMSQTSDSSVDYPKLALLPPPHGSTNIDLKAAQDELENVERIHSRIRWVIENGTLPSEELEQVEKLSAWTFDFCRWAHSSFDVGAKQNALEFTRAAKAIVNSAEYLCRKCYLAPSSMLHPTQ